MEEGWDLQAVVRGCRGEAATSSAAADPFPCSSSPSLHEHEGDDVLLYFPDTSCSKSVLQELLELCEPFLPRRTPQADPQLRLRVPVQSTRSKRRKNQLKKVVCQVPADGMSADMWAWRKYGQKPIKGSPFPRGYYRCSSSKGCPARKQVERSRADPGTFVITYTAEHNHAAPTHRNSLAGSTRHKTPPAAPKVSSRSPTEEKKDEEEPDEPEEDEEEGVLMVSDMEVLGEDDMMFLDLDGSGEESPEGFSTVFSSSSWVETSAAAAAAAAAGGD